MFPDEKKQQNYKIKLFETRMVADSVGRQKKQGLVSMFGNHTTYRNGDDWGMVQMALFYQNNKTTGFHPVHPTKIDKNRF